MSEPTDPAGPRKEGKHKLDRDGWCEVCGEHNVSDKTPCVPLHVRTVSSPATAAADLDEKSCLSGGDTARERGIRKDQADRPSGPAHPDLDEIAFKTRVEILELLNINGIRQIGLEIDDIIRGACEVAMKLLDEPMLYARLMKAEYTIAEHQLEHDRLQRIIEKDTLRIVELEESNEHLAHALKAELENVEKLGNQLGAATAYSQGVEEKNRELQREREGIEGLLDAKWLDPVCCDKGCQSLFLKEAREQLAQAQEEVKEWKQRAFDAAAEQR